MFNLYSSPPADQHRDGDDAAGGGACGARGCICGCCKSASLMLRHRAPRASANVFFSCVRVNHSANAWMRRSVLLSGRCLLAYLCQQIRFFCSASESRAKGINLANWGQTMKELDAVRTRLRTCGFARRNQLPYSDQVNELPFSLS
jgi:hypothetical protein